jgi:hypothetical protein
LRSPLDLKNGTPEVTVKRIYIPLLILTVLATAAAGSADVSAEVDRSLRSAADYVRTMFRAFDEQTIYAFAGVSMGSEFEELEILERIARSERGREVVAAACRQAMNEGDAVLTMLAYNMLAEIDAADATFLLPELYETLGDEDVILLATFADTPLRACSEETPGPGVDAFYELIERDLRSGDKAAGVKAAKIVAFMHSDRAAALAAVGMENPDAEVRRWCVLSILTTYYGMEEPSAAAAGVVEAALADEDASVRAFSARQLGMMGDSDYLPQLYELLDDKEVEVRRAAANSVDALLRYAPGAAEAPTKMLLERLRKETDGVTRCYLGEAYGAATTDAEGVGRYLTDDGYWAFYSGEWSEKDLDGYYAECDAGSWGG